MLHSLQRVLWLEFIVWGLLNKLSATFAPKKNNLTLFCPQNVSPFLFRLANMIFDKLHPSLEEWDFAVASYQ